jgi:hypothetical protein
MLQRQGRRVADATILFPILDESLGPDFTVFRNKSVELDNHVFCPLKIVLFKNNGFNIRPMF